MLYVAMFNRAQKSLAVSIYLEDFKALYRKLPDYCRESPTLGAGKKLPSVKVDLWEAFKIFPKTLSHENLDYTEPFKWSLCLVSFYLGTFCFCTLALVFVMQRWCWPLPSIAEMASPQFCCHLNRPPKFGVQTPFHLTFAIRQKLKWLITMKKYFLRWKTRVGSQLCNVTVTAWKLDLNNICLNDTYYSDPGGRWNWDLCWAWRGLVSKATDPLLSLNMAVSRCLITNMIVSRC